MPTNFEEFKALGAFGAHHHLRQQLVFLDMPTLRQPEMYIGHVGKFLDAQETLPMIPGDSSARGFLLPSSHGHDST